MDRGRPLSAARVRPARRAASSTTCRPPTRRATWTCCAPRSATGASRYVGYSYGSYLGVTYANLFPRQGPRRSSSTACSTRSHGRPAAAGRRRRLPFSTRLRSDAGAQATLNEFFRLCDAGGDACAFSGDAAARYAALAQRLRGGAGRDHLPGRHDRSCSTTPTSSASRSGRCTTRRRGPTSPLLLADVEAQVCARAGSAPGSSGLYQRDSTGLHADDAACASTSRRTTRIFVEGFPGVAVLGQRQPGRLRRLVDRRGERPTRSSATSGAIWTWAASICAEWRGFDRDRYMGPFTRSDGQPDPASSATRSIRPLATRARRSSTG